MYSQTRTLTEMEIEESEEKVGAIVTIEGKEKILLRMDMMTGSTLT